MILGTKKRAGEVDRDGIAPAGLGYAGRSTGLAESARVVEGDVEPAIGLYRQRHQRLGIILRADVAGERHGAATAALDLSHQARQFGLAAGADDDLGAFGPEKLGGGYVEAPSLLHKTFSSDFLLNVCYPFSSPATYLS